ncbi:Ubiquitin carboxyl-terminal hydrolase 4 [Phytophthora citrophthora]|uniref:Ubiquitin carboxyl-terminal hydrolase 4 n=1 Tax=Phytophthora citrophthora TaxID=4793 RepID=A0AAD9GQI8_9STRA|nr:Ubiquitin carboxyl-terminal hydrolase 4 [Phytophthora citrophthora]
MKKSSSLRRLAATLEQQLNEDQLHDGEDWFVVSSAWWARVLGTSRCQESDENAGHTDEDSEDSDSALPRGNSDLIVENAVLLDLELSSRKREVAVLKPMLVEGKDYRLVSQRVWNQLSDRFGFDWEISRPVVTRGANNRVVEVNPVTFEVWGWHTGLDGPMEVLDAEQKPLVLVASENCSLKELQVTIWKAAGLEPHLKEMFPDVTEENVNLTVQVCYRMDEDAPWTPLRDAVVKEDRGNNGFTNENNPDILVESTTVGELQLEKRDYKPGKEKLHHLLVEGRFVAQQGTEQTDWRHHKFYSEVQAEAWRFTLEINQLIDANDTDKKWYESRVIDLSDTKVKVHYRGWTAKWDEWINRTSTRLAPLHTKVRNWRNFQIGDEVLVGKAIQGKSYPEWRVAHISDLQKVSKDNSLRIELDVDGTKHWRDAQDEMLCPVGTHKAANASAVVVPPVSSYSPASSYNRYEREFEAGKGRPSFEGVVGLSNLGNTCFMNSMLQCLINTPPLRSYFLQKDPETGKPFFTKEINRDNPLGMKGMVAVNFASLLRNMWSNEFKVVTPTKLKSVIGQYAPQFAGYQQQDSQELMNFLLDGLHEDLNRVKQKPYTKPVEGNGRSDAEVAQEEWQQYLRRNDSVIVDNFMGQLRSHVTCSNPDCGNESITFDPYMSLSVPIPNDETVTIQVQLFWAKGDIPMKYAVKLPKDGTLVDVKLKLSELSGIPISRIFFVEVWNHKILRAYSDRMAIDRLRDGGLHAYELELPVIEYSFSSPTIRPPAAPRKLGTLQSDPEPVKQMHLVELLHQAPVASPVDGRANSDGYDMLVEEGYGPKQRRVEVELFNTPLLVSIDRKWSKAEIHAKVWQVVHRLVATKDSRTSFGCGEDQQLPYRLHVTEPNSGTTFISDLPCDDEPVDVSDKTKRPFSFTLEWNRNGYQRGYDETSAKRIELHESMKDLKITPKADTLTLFDCLTKFTEREQLGEANTWYCPKCKNHVRAFKKFDLFSLPKVLIFQLKRFRYAQNAFYLNRDKISTLVDFPIEDLDLSAFLIGPGNGSEPVYDLFAVSEHWGGLGGGHYTAVAKNPVSKRWFNFNDSHTSTTSPEAAVSPKAYVLFYIRRDQA